MRLSRQTMTTVHDNLPPPSHVQVPSLTSISLYASCDRRGYDMARASQLLDYTNEEGEEGNQMIEASILRRRLLLIPTDDSSKATLGRSKMIVWYYCTTLPI